jgi:F-type H+-transporting ATPase subunit b
MIELLLAAAAEDAAHGAVPLTEDTSFWVSLGFVVVIGLFGWLGVHKRIASSLDKRAQDIADELDRARALRDEAQEILAKYQRRQREAEDEAEAIVEQAKRDAARIAEDARVKIEEQLDRRAKAAEDKIARAEAQALAEVRSQTADLAVEAACEIIRIRMDQGAQAALAERAIDEIRAKLH